RHRHHGGRRHDTELVFVLLLQLRQLEHRHVADEIEHLIDCAGHGLLSPSVMPWAAPWFPPWPAAPRGAVRRRPIKRPSASPSPVRPPSPRAGRSSPPPRRGTASSAR